VKKKKKEGGQSADEKTLGKESEKMGDNRQKGTRIVTACFAKGRATGKIM